MMNLNFLKALCLVAIGGIGTATLTSGLMQQPSASLTPAMTIAGLAIYLLAWIIGLYITYR